MVIDCDFYQSRFQYQRNTKSEKSDTFDQVQHQLRDQIWNKLKQQDQYLKVMVYPDQPKKISSQLTHETHNRNIQVICYQKNI